MDEWIWVDGDDDGWIWMNGYEYGWIWTHIDMDGLDE